MGEDVVAVASEAGVEVVGSGLEVEVGGRTDEDDGVGVMRVSRWVSWVTGSLCGG